MDKGGKVVTSGRETEHGEQQTSQVWTSLLRCVVTTLIQVSQMPSRISWTAHRQPYPLRTPHLMTFSLKLPVFYTKNSLHLWHLCDLLSFGDKSGG